MESSRLSQAVPFEDVTSSRWISITIRIEARARDPRALQSRTRIAKGLIGKGPRGLRKQTRSSQPQRPYPCPRSVSGRSQCEKDEKDEKDGKESRSGSGNA